MLRMTKRKSRILAGLMAFVLVFSNIAANVQTVYATNIVPGSGMTLLPDLNEDPSQKTAPEETEPAEDITLNILPEAEYDEEAGQLVWNGGWDTYKYSEQEGVTLGQVLLQDSEYSALAEELTGTWSSDDTDVLAMYDDGDALVKSTGYATVTFTYEAPKAEPEVVAEAAEVPVDPTVTEAAQPENEAAADDVSSEDEGEAAEDEAVVDDGDVVDEGEVTDGEAVVDGSDVVDEGEVTDEAAADGEEVADEAGQSENEDDAAADAVSEDQPAADENADNEPAADDSEEEIVDEATPSNSDKVEEPSVDEEENAAPSETVTEPETLPAAPANEQNAPEPEEEYPMADGTELTWVVKVESDRVTVYSDAPYNDLMELAVEAGYEWTGFGSSRVEEFGLPTDGIWKSLDEDVVSLTADGDMTIMVADGVCQIAYSYTENDELYVALWNVKVGVEISETKVEYYNWNDHGELTELWYGVNSDKGISVLSVNGNVAYCLEHTVDLGDVYTSSGIDGNTFADTSDTRDKGHKALTKDQLALINLIIQNGYNEDVNTNSDKYCIRWGTDKEGNPIYKYAPETPWLEHPCTYEPLHRTLATQLLIWAVTENGVTSGNFENMTSTSVRTGMNNMLDLKCDNYYNSQHRPYHDHSGSSIKERVRVQYDSIASNVVKAIKSQDSVITFTEIGRTWQDGVGTLTFNANVSLAGYRVVSKSPEVSIISVVDKTLTVQVQPKTDVETNQTFSFSLEIPADAGGLLVWKQKNAQDIAYGWGNVSLGKSGTATFTVRPDEVKRTGELTVTKRVNWNSQAPADPSQVKFRITINLSHATESMDRITVVPENGAVVSKNANSATITVDLAQNDSITIKEIPAGATYTVEEKNTTVDVGDGKRVQFTSSGRVTGSIEANKISQAAITNTYPQNVSVSLRKTDKDGRLMTGVEFDFERCLKTLSNESWELVPGYEAGILTANGVWSATGLDGAYKYRFREKSPQDGLIIEANPVVANENGVTNIPNDYEKGSLTVKKVVEGDHDADTKFEFTVELDFSPLLDRPYMNEAPKGILVDNNKITANDIKNNKCTVKKLLGDTEELVISNIPKGTLYTIKENSTAKVMVPDGTEENKQQVQREFKPEVAVTVNGTPQSASGSITGDGITGSITSDAQQIEVTATNTNEKVWVGLKKQDEKGRLLEGVPFALYKVVGGAEELQGTYHTNSSGQIIVTDLARGFKYRFREQFSDAPGLTNSDGKEYYEVDATENSGMCDVAAVNGYETGNLSIKKEVIGNSKDAEFDFEVKLTEIPVWMKQAGHQIVVKFNREDVTSSAVKGAGNTEVTITYKLGRGDEMTIEGIPVGANYTVTENPTTTVDGEKVTFNPRKVVIVDGRDITIEKGKRITGEGIKGTIGKNEQSVKVVVTNTNPTVDIQLTKKDTEGKPINGVKFTLQYKTEDPSSAWEDYPEGNPYMTDENGEIRIDGLPRYKTTSSGGELDYSYRFVEIFPDGLKDPEGHDGIYNVHTTEGLVTDLDDSIEAVNDYKVGSLTVTKNLTSVSYSKDVKFPFTVELDVPVYAQNAIGKISAEGATVERKGMSLVITKDLVPGVTLTIGNIPIGTGYVIHEETNVTVNVNNKDVTVSYHPASVTVDGKERTDYAAIEDGRAGIGGTILGDDGTKVEVVATNEGYLDTELALEISKSFNHVLDNEERADSADAYPEGDFTFKLSYLYNKKYKTELDTITLNKANDWTGSFAPISYTEAELKNVDADGTRNSDFWYVIEEELTEEQQKVYTRVDPVYARVQVRSFNGMITTSVQYFMDADGTKPFDSSRYSGQKFRFVNRQYDAVLHAYKAFGKMVDNEAVAPDDPEEGESYDFTLYEWENGEWSNLETKTASEATDWQTEFTRHFYYYNDDSQNIGTHWYKIQENMTDEQERTYATDGQVYASIEVRQTGEEGKLETVVRYYRNFDESTGTGLDLLTDNGTDMDHGTVTNTKNEIDVKLFKQFAKVVDGETVEETDEEKAAHDSETYKFDLKKYQDDGTWGPAETDEKGEPVELAGEASRDNDWKVSFRLHYSENDRPKEGGSRVYWYQIVENLSEEQKETYVGSKLYARVEITDDNSDGKYEVETKYYTSVMPNMTAGHSDGDALTGLGELESGRVNITNTAEYTSFEFYKQVDHVLNNDSETDVDKQDGEKFNFELSKWENGWQPTGKTATADAASGWTAFFEMNYAKEANDKAVMPLTYWYRISEAGQDEKYTAHPVYVKVDIDKINGLHTAVSYYKDFDTENGTGLRPFGEGEKISFRNVENQATLDLYKKVTRVTDGTSEDYNDQSEDSFEFELHSGAVEDGEIVWTSMNRKSTASRDSQWEAGFTLNYNADDAAEDAREGSSTYWYMIRENQTDVQEKDYVNDGPVYAAVTVTRKAEDINDITTQVVYYKEVSVGSDGQITGSNAFDSNIPTYENVMYRVTLKPDVIKTVIGYDGQALEKPDATFTFQLYEKVGGDYVLLRSAQNDADGKVDFEPLVYTGADEGTHTYRMLEVAEGGDYRYDTTVYDFTVEVGPSHSSELQAVPSYDMGEPFEFTNDKIFTEEDQWTPRATKTLNGQLAGADGFTFELKDEAGSVISTATSAGNGSVTFATITYGEGQDGVHTYTINERAGSSGLIIYDAKVYTVTVTVEKTAAGNRVASVAYTLDGAAVTDVLFENQTRSTTSTTPNRTGTTIPDNEVPQGPGTPEIITISDEPTPLSDFETIEDEDVPLAFLAPMTGDNRPVGAAALFGLLALGMMGAFGILASKKDEEDA